MVEDIKKKEKYRINLNIEGNIWKGNLYEVKFDGELKCDLC